MKNQEKHWKQGYEQIFNKYSRLKQSVAEKEQEMNRL